MAITINGKTYRNLQEQVKKNMDDIEELQGKIIDPENFVTIDTDQTITGEKTFDSNITIINSHDIDAPSSTAYFGSIYENGHDISDVYATKDDVYTKAEADLTFADVDDVYTKSEVDEMNSDMEDYVDDKIDNVNAIIGDGYLSQLTATFGTSGNYKSVLNLGNLVEYSDYEDNGTNNTQFKENRSLYISVEKGSIITLVGYPNYSSYKIITDETTYDNLTGTTTLTALSTQVIEIKSLSSSNYYISLNVTNYIKETLTDAINDLGTKAIQKNADGNITEKLYLVNGISSADGEETDSKATISLDSGVRRSILALNAGGEDGYANIELRGGTSGDGYVTITGDVTVDSIYRPKVGTGANQEQVAYLSDIPASVSGVNNGTNWTSITIGNDTYGIPTGGSGSIVAGTGIDITNGVVSVDNTVAMKTDIPTQNDIKYNNNSIYTNNIATISASQSQKTGNSVIYITDAVKYLHLGNVDVKVDIPTIPIIPTQLKTFTYTIWRYTSSPSSSDPRVYMSVIVPNQTGTQPTSWNGFLTSLTSGKYYPASGYFGDGDNRFIIDSVYCGSNSSSVGYVYVYGYPATNNYTADSHNSVTLRINDSSVTLH